MELVASITLVVALWTVWLGFRPNVWTATPGSTAMHLRRDEVLRFLEARDIDPNVTYRVDFAEQWSRVWRYHLDTEGRKHLASDCGGATDEVCRVLPAVIDGTLEAA